LRTRDAIFLTILTLTTQPEPEGLSAG